MSIRSKAFMSFCYVRCESGETRGIPLVQAVSTADYPNNTPDTLLRLSARLGLPLYYSVGEDLDKTQPISYQNSTLRVLPDNPILRVLSRQKSPARGLSYTKLGDVPRRNILISRADGQDLHPRDIVLMFMYADGKFIELRNNPTLTHEEKFQQIFRGHEAGEVRGVVGWL